MKDVYWLLELRVNDGQGDALKTLMAEMVEYTDKNEPNTVNYEWFNSEDGTVCHIYERYTDSAAGSNHLAGFAQFAERFMTALTPTRLTVYGSPSPELKSTLDAFSPVYMEFAAGVTR